MVNDMDERGMALIQDFKTRIEKGLGQAAISDLAALMQWDCVKCVCRTVCEH